MHKKSQPKRNYGYGRKAGFAGKKAIRAHLKKHPASAAAHVIRWKKFCDILFAIFCIQDVRKIDNAILKKCAFALRKMVEQGELSVSYAQNILSTANVVIRLMRKDMTIYISPSHYIGRRCRIRKTAPKGMDKRIIYALALDLFNQGKELYAIIFILIREFGLRKREACLFDARAALNQAIRYDKIRISKGTKGGYGRKAARWIKVTSLQIELLEQAALLQGSNRSLVPEGKTLVQFIRSIDQCWSKIRKQYRLAKVHDLRACYACERYHQITGIPAPVLNFDKIAVDKRIDKKARRIISHELGHKRIDIISAYVGGRR